MRRGLALMWAAGAILLLLVIVRSPSGTATVENAEASSAGETRSPVTARGVTAGTGAASVRSQRLESVEPAVERASSAERARRSLTGRVTREDGTPLAGAVVSESSGTSVTTDADGRYVMEGLPLVLWQVAASHAECVTSEVRRLGPEDRTQDFSLRSRTPVTLSGRVIHHRTRQAMTEFSITASGLTVTRAAAEPGRFEIAGLFAGDTASFRIEAPGFAARNVREALPEQLTGKYEREYELGAGASLKGRVVRSGSKEPVAGVGVLVQSFGRDQGVMRGRADRDAGNSTTTGDDGTFELTGVPPGQARLRLSPPGPLVEVSRFIGEIRHEQERNLGDLVVGQGGTIRGRVIRVPGEEPVAGQRVELGPFYGWRGAAGGRAETGEGHLSAITDAGGEFQISNVSPGRYQVETEKSEVRESVTIEGEETRNVTLRLGSGMLRGLILKDGSPVRSMLTFSRQSGGSPSARLRTGEDGAFELTGLPPGLWKMMVGVENGRGTELEANMPEHGIMEQTFVLPSGVIVGRVVNAEDQPVAGASIALLVSDPGTGFQSIPVRTRNVESGVDGSFRLQDRPAGPAALMARKTGLGSSPIVEINVPGAGESELVILRIGEGATGTLVSTALNLEGGGPVPDAWCLLESEKGRVAHNQRRGPDGVMTIPDLPVGTYRVQVSASGYTVSEQTVAILAGQTETITDVIGPAGAFRWTVVDETGAGVGGVLCRLVPADPLSIESPREGSTDATGLWTTRGLLPGSYTATAHPVGRAPVSRSVTVTVNQISQETTQLD